MFIYTFSWSFHEIFKFFHGVISHKNESGHAVNLWIDGKRFAHARVIVAPGQYLSFWWFLGWYPCWFHIQNAPYWRLQPNNWRWCNRSLVVMLFLFSWPGSQWRHDQVIPLPHTRAFFWVFVYLFYFTNFDHFLRFFVSDNFFFKKNNYLLLPQFFCFLFFVFWHTPILPPWWMPSNR